MTYIILYNNNSPLLHMMVNACNPSSWQAEAGGFQI